MYKFGKGARDVDNLEDFAVSSYAKDQQGAEVPAELGWFQREFSRFTQRLALIIMDVYDASERGVRVLEKDFKSVSGGWSKGGVRGAYDAFGEVISWA